MAVEYSRLNLLELQARSGQQLASRAGKTFKRDPLVIQDIDDYPQPTKAKRKAGKDVDGRTIWETVGRWRGIDPRVMRGYREKYDGAHLRAIRAIKGVGRPWLTLLEPKPAT